MLSLELIVRSGGMFLINSQDRQIEIYCQGQQVEVQKAPLTVSCEDVLQGFVLNLQRIFL